MDRRDWDPKAPHPRDGEQVNPDTGEIEPIVVDDTPKPKPKRSKHAAS